MVCVDANNVNLGDCLPQSGYCVAGDSCSADSYANPDVPITVGPSRNDAIIAALQSTSPTGFTPTTPALQGAIQYAQSWRTTHPGRTAAVVLATDGFPTECTDLASDPVAPVVQAAQAGVSGTPSILTYVIGVFSPQDELTGASDILNSIATAGGTGQAFLVDTSANATGEFLTALQNISAATAAPCEFQLPADNQLDYDAVNLLLTRGDGTQTQLVNVGSAMGCTASGDIGWYYLSGPDTDVPYQINVCPSVCDQFTATPGGRIDLEIGCSGIAP